MVSILSALDHRLSDGDAQFSLWVDCYQIVGERDAYVDAASSSDGATSQQQSFGSPPRSVVRGTGFFGFPHPACEAAGDDRTANPAAPRGFHLSAFPREWLATWRAAPDACMASNLAGDDKGIKTRR